MDYTTGIRGRHCRQGLVMLVSLGCATLSARAQTLPTLPPPAAPPSSTARLASQVVEGLMAPPAPPWDAAVGGARVELVVMLAGAPDNEALSAFLGDAMEARLRTVAGFGRRVSRRAEASERWEVALAVKDGHLMATARRHALPTNIWEVMAGGGAAVLATAYANVPIDLELRTLLGLGRRAVRLDTLRVVPVTAKSSAVYRGARVLDCAVTDLDGDRLPEMVLLQRDAVRATRWASGGFSQGLGTTPLDGLTINEAPLREPLGRLLVVTREDGRRILLAASSDRAELLAVALGAGGLEPVPVPIQTGWPLYATAADRFVAAPWPRGIDSLEGGLTEARVGSSSATWLGAASGVHDVRAFVSDGQGVLVAALVGGGVRLVPGGDNPRAGVASALVDFDADGAFEILTTSQRIEGPDRLGLARLPSPPGARWSATTLWTGSVPDPVTAMCAGDVDRDGYHEIIVATWDGRRSELNVVVPR